MTLLVTSSYSAQTNFDIHNPIYVWKNLMVQAGFVVVSSSNGTTLSAGDIITSGAVLSNANAYFIIKQPLSATASHGGWRREWAIQRGSTGNQWRVSYTVSGSHNTGGTATLIPTGSDRRWVMETETQWQLGNFSVTFHSNTLSQRFFMAVDNAPPHGWYFVGQPAITTIHTYNDPTCLMLYDPLLSGTFAAQDTDPTINYFSIQGQSALTLLSVNTNGTAQMQSGSFSMIPKGWIAKQSVSESFNGFAIPIPRIFVGSTRDLVDAGASFNCFGGEDFFIPYYVKPSTIGIGVGTVKGFSSMLKGRFSPAFATSLYSSGSTTRNWISFKNYVLPWDGSAIRL